MRLMAAAAGPRFACIMKKWIETIFGVLLLAGWMVVANTADGALRANDARRAADSASASAPHAEWVAATRADPPGR